ncbi:unnamed protein product [Discula destructiva]
MRSTTSLLASLPAAFAHLAHRQAGSNSAATTASATWSDECLAAEGAFVMELEAIETSSVAPALQSYLATVSSAGITDYCEPTNAPSIVSAEWHSEVVSIDAIVNVYSSDISQVQSCLTSYETAAGTPYELAAAASALFGTISSLQACTSTTAPAFPSATGLANMTATTLSPAGNTASGAPTTATGTAAAGTSGVVTAGAAREGLMSTGVTGFVAAGLVLGAAML